MTKKQIIELLKIREYRITKSRESLIELFCENEKDYFLFDELLKIEAAKGHTNVATMYNNLAVLTKEGFVREFNVHGQKNFQVVDKKQYVNLICNRCKEVKNVMVDELYSVQEAIRNQFNFRDHTTVMEIYGCCDACQQIHCENCTKTCSKHEICINENNYPIEELEIMRYLTLLKREFNDLRDLSLVFVSEEEIQKMNLEFRGIDRPTDVLSFVEDEEDYLGDLIICYPIAKKQAVEYGHSLEREIIFLITHGYLHLQGYDHETEVEEKEMFKRQEQILEKIGVGRWN
ncbi:MAG: rRNA maturation RNase YbeY [Mycoplasmatales bacterium]